MIDLKSPPFTLLAERDMDLLVLEEMLSSLSFEHWIVEKLYGGARKLFRTLGAWHTPSLEPLGSVNILFVFEEAERRRRCAILIENKIDQPKQDLQAQRYFEYGEKGVQDGVWDEYLTCLFSPQAYFSSLEPSEYFSSYLSYEELEEWFSRPAAESRSATPERAVYKKTLVRQAINQGVGRMHTALQAPVMNEMAQQQSFAPAYVQEPVSVQPAFEEAPMYPVMEDRPVLDRMPEQMLMSEPVPQQMSEPAPQPMPQSGMRSSLSDFRVFPGGVFNLPEGYREAEDTVVGGFFNEMLSFAKQYYPALGMKKPVGSTQEAGWVEFLPQDFPREVTIIHKMPQGFVDLSFAMTPLSMIQTPYQPYLDTDMELRESGKTAIIRINVSEIIPQDGFSAQKEKIAVALQKAQKLYQLYQHVVNKGGAGQGARLQELYL